MPDMKPVSLEDLLGAAAGSGGGTNTPAMPAVTEDLTPVRFFTKDGLNQVAALLKTIRTDKTLHREEVEDLLEDPQFAKPLPGTYAIDRTKSFATKLDLCEYFTSVFDNTFLETHRKDAGLWTWLALAYYPQFVKTKGSIVDMTADARWIYDPERYRLSQRHFIAGPLYLYRDFSGTSGEVKDMLFFGPPKEFGGFVDAVTYTMEGTRIPALMQVAAWLYYDGNSQRRLKKGVLSQENAGAVRQFVRVAAQLAQTRDFYGVADASELWNVLPPQFNAFKGNAKH